ncbi:MAG TPA: hypothetical protein DD426_05270 [Clostridiaceae bacterium]|nr:hypothetical protein [Clostridiaceae bacterium]
MDEIVLVIIFKLNSACYSGMINFGGVILEFEIKIHEHLFGDERPFNNCHASTLILLPSDEILVAYFGGTEEGNDDVAIWYSRRRGGRWSSPLKAADIKGIPHWNPVLYREEDGTIYLFYKVGHKIPQWRTMLITSRDNGQTWSESKELVEGDRGGRGPVKNKLIRLSNGTWLAPASVEGEYWNAFTDSSFDRGKTWIIKKLIR